MESNHELTNRRRGDRLEASAATSCSFRSLVTEHSGPAVIENISREGICLIVPCRLELGTMLKIELSNPSRELKMTSLVRVMHLTPAASGFLVGGRLINPLTYRELGAVMK